MKKIIFAIFAHPDDESFGPSGTLLMEIVGGSEVHLITLTAGEAGMNPDNVEDLAQVRLSEWRQAGELMSASSMHHLGHIDGQLNNEIMQRASQQIIEIVSQISDQTSGEFAIEFISNDLNGISGHIDHIVAARAACLAFYQLREQGLPMKQIRLSCIPRSTLPDINTDWLYMEPGRTENEIGQIVDASQHYDTILKIIRAHRTQRRDGENHIKNRGKAVALNYFITMK